MNFVKVSPKNPVDDSDESSSKAKFLDKKISEDKEIVNVKFKSIFWHKTSDMFF
jgi:hypothetical protein